MSAQAAIDHPRRSARDEGFELKRTVPETAAQNCVVWGTALRGRRSALYRAGHLVDHERGALRGGAEAAAMASPPVIERFRRQHPPQEKLAVPISADLELYHY